MRKSIVKYELLILYVFCYAVHFDLWLMNSDIRICAGNTVDFSLFHLFLKQGSLSNTNADTGFFTANVWYCRLHLLSFLLDHDIEFDVHLSPCNLVCISSVGLLLCQFCLFAPSLFSSLFKPLYIC